MDLSLAITLSNRAVHCPASTTAKLQLEGANISLNESAGDCKLSYDGVHNSGIGQWDIDASTTVLATDLYVVELCEIRPRNSEKRRMASCYIDLEALLPLVNGGESLDVTEDFIVEGDSDAEHAPQIQYSFTVTAFRSSSQKHQLFMFRMNSEDVMDDCEFSRRSFELQQYLEHHLSIVLVLSWADYKRARTRCISVIDFRRNCPQFMPPSLTDIIDGPLVSATYNWLMFPGISFSREQEAPETSVIFRSTGEQVTARETSSDKGGTITVVEPMFPDSEPPSLLKYSHRELYPDFAEAIDSAPPDEQSAILRELFVLPDTDPTKHLGMLSWCACLAARSDSFWNRDQIHDLDDAKECIRLLKIAEPFILIPLDRVIMYSLWNIAHHRLWLLSHDVTVLDDAVDMGVKAIAIPLPHFPIEQAMMLHAFSETLLDRFELLQDADDLERALWYNEQTLGLVETSPHMTFPLVAHRLKVLLARYNLHHEETDLKEGFTLSLIIINDAPAFWPSAPEVYYQYCFNLMTTLGFSEQNLRLLLPVHYTFYANPQRQKWRSHIRGDEAYCTQLITMLRGFLDLQASNPRFRLRDESLTALSLLLLYRRTLFPGHSHDLIDAARLVTQFTPERRGLKDLIRGIVLFQCAFPETPSTPSPEVKQALDLGSMFEAQKAFGNIGMSRLPVYTPSVRLQATYWLEKIMLILREVGVDTPDLMSATRRSLELAMSALTDAVWIGNSMSTKQQILSRIDMTIPNRAATIALKLGDCRAALEYLEQGRSILWDQLLSLRAPLDGVMAVNAELGTRLERLANALVLSSARDSALELRESEARKHRKLTTEWEACISKVRDQPGLGKFLLPKDFEYLSRATEDTITVVVNVTYRCDAVVILPHLGDGIEQEIFSVKLPDCSMEVIQNMHVRMAILTQESYEYRGPDVTTKRQAYRAPFDDSDDSEEQFSGVLGDLWYKIVFPILCEMMSRRPDTINCEEGSERSRIRWCLTSELAFLPIHAAGDYNIPGKGNKTHDFFVSSYIPTLNSIIHPNDAKPHNKSPKLLAVACSSPQGQVPIPAVDMEVARIKTQATLSAHCDFVEATEKEATSEHVLEEMGSATWVHFACHGVQNATRPSDSALLLANGTRLSLADIASVKLPNAELAFLSACQTATGHMQLPSESVHLAAGMLLAGYRSVIATMWSIEDRHAPKVAEEVYGYLLREKDRDNLRPDYRESAVALDRAVARLREQVGENSFMAWVPYIHIGV